MERSRDSTAASVHVGGRGIRRMVPRDILGSMPESLLEADAFYDAGDEGCAGPALTDINRLLEALRPGQALEVRSADRTGRESFRAFCRLRGFTIEGETPGPDGADHLLVRKP
jgi:TusA-related sulfurtransferase